MFGLKETIILFQIQSISPKSQDQLDHLEDVMGSDVSQEKLVPSDHWEVLWRELAAGRKLY